MSRRLLLCYWILASMMLMAVVATLAIGGRPDPIGPAWTLDGAWRFHAGDDLKWADPQTDDRDWDRVDLVSLPTHRDLDVGLPGYLAGWHAHGYPTLEGYGWYRRRVELPAQGDVVLLGPTMVDDGYEMFWDGKRVGGVGTLDRPQKVIGAHPYVVRVPRTPGAHAALLAIRTYMLPGFGRDKLSGGLRSVPTLATSSFGGELHRAQWMRTIAGYIVEVAIPAMMFLLAGIALVVARRTGRPGFARWLATALVATAFLRLGNAFAAWTDLPDPIMLDRQNAILLSPLAMLAWTAAWNAWTGGRDRPIVLVVALIAWASRVIGVIAHVGMLVTIGRYAFIALFAVVAVRVTMRGERRSLVLATMAVIAAALFINELGRLGIPDIWFPFNIGVTLTQYAYALALPLLAWLLIADSGRHASSGAQSGGIWAGGGNVGAPL